MTQMPPISGVEKYVTSDGRLTWEGQRVFAAISDILNTVGQTAAPTGGGTVDAEARTAIAAIIAAAS